MNFQILKEMDDHFIVKHPDGSSFKVAKQVLPKGFEEKMRSYCSGGKVEGYADGGEVDELAVEAESKPGLFQQIGDFFTNPNKQVEQAITPEGQATLESAKQEMFPPAQPAPASVAPQPTAPAPIEVPASQQESVFTPPATPVVQIKKPDNAFDKAFTTEKQGIQAQAKAAGDEGTAVSQALQKSIDDQDRLYKAFEVKKKAQDEALSILRGKIEKDEVDPNRIWHQMGTGRQVASVLSILFSGVGAGLAHQENLALKVMDKAIDRDIEAQKANKENQRSLYSMYLQQTNSEREATLMTQKHLLDVQQAQANKIAAQFKTPQAAAQAQVLGAQIDLKKAMVDRQLEQEQLLKGIGQRPFSKDLLAAAPKEIRERAVMLPDGKTVVAANTPEGAKEANEKIRVMSPLRQTLEELGKVSAGALVPGSHERERAEVLANQAKLQIAAVKGFKRFSPELFKELGKSFDNPTEIIDNIRGNQKTQQLLKSLDTELDSTLSNVSPAYVSPKGIPGAKKKVFQ
jgi:hypothetical protein